MKTIITSCDRCGRGIKDGTPDKADIYCYKNTQRQEYRHDSENRTDKQVHLCPECYGHFLSGFLTASAARMGIKPVTPAHQPHSTETEVLWTETEEAVIKDLASRGEYFGAGKEGAKLLREYGVALPAPQETETFCKSCRTHVMSDGTCACPTREVPIVSKS